MPRPLFLSEIPGAPPPAVGEWLSILFFLVGGALAVIKLVAHFKGPAEMRLPQPMTVKAATNLVERRELEALRAEVHEIRTGMSQVKDEIHRVETSLMKAGAERADAIHARLGQIIMALPMRIPK